MGKDTKEIKQSLLQKRLFAFINSTPGIVHNLSNPLTIISTRSQLLQLKMPENQDFKKLIDQSKTIELILNNLVFISQNISNDKLQPIDINALIKNELEFLNADPFFKHNIIKDFQYHPNPLMITSSYFHVSTLVYCIIQVLIFHLKDSVENKIKIISDKTSDSVMIRIGSHVLNNPEVNNFALSISSPSDNTRLQNLYDASLLAKEIGITFLINNDPESIEFIVSIPIKQ